MKVVDKLDATSTSARIRHVPSLRGGNVYAMRLLVNGGSKAGASNVVTGTCATV